MGGTGQGDSRIRLARPGDGEALARIYAPSVTEAATSFETEPPDAAEMERRAASVLAKTPWLVLEEAGAVVAYAYAGPHRDRAAYRWCVEVSAYVAPASRRRGAAGALYASLLALLGLQGFRNAYAGVTLPNPASVALHEAMGFSRVGVYREIGWKLGRWHDVLWLERALAPRSPDPREPLALAAIVGRPEFEAALALGRARWRTPGA